ncbi:ABC transporter permease [uncultured Alsobacter sp.]|uniref:ABC transporter permease n=1 Tax=uncultured Alsobacter sp. TaxID=1748258 RepID=UPI0025DF5487|nr:ABC transporter permease [uncultured Alsobacter sp.]
MTDTAQGSPAPTTLPLAARSDFVDRLRSGSEYVVIPLIAVAISAVLFSMFLLVLGKDPVEFFSLLWRGGFGTAFSWQNSLLRAAPLILTALCVALPARAGLVIIGGEGALVLGGLFAAMIALPLKNALPPVVLMPLMAIMAMAAGGFWIGLVGIMRHARGVNETIASLLMSYIAIAIMNFLVEGPLRDPASANKPSTGPIGEGNMVTAIPGTDVHWGLAAGIILAVILWIVIDRTTYGFALRVTGGNARAAKAQGLPVGTLMVSCCAIAGACAGLAGYFEVAAIHGKANASLIAGYGFTGILVAFLARHNPIVIVPVAILFGGIAAAGGLIQRRMGLPDASVLLFQSLIFVVLLISETLYGRLRIFQPRTEAERT